ncbi:MAG: hypothetical protein EI684_02810 [Candidatus Viridilinea halotolerans]|uniref:Uncharacterized protein n=1 Tax=Candidatus Viridilinea halotolerans TaxID=2491704 RepID=A0A426U8I1_9CHLR|nr:MAG: hypothetical protein EI684_02810 [Candidatus Viridilinea halotolerans]
MAMVEREYIPGALSDTLAVLVASVPLTDPYGPNAPPPVPAVLPGHDLVLSTFLWTDPHAMLTGLHLLAVAATVEHARDLLVSDAGHDDPLGEQVVLLAYRDWRAGRRSPLRGYGPLWAQLAHPPQQITTPTALRLQPLPKGRGGPKPSGE